MKNRPIGFFDSGIGGLSVLEKTLNILENESFLYFCDTKNVPYGNKTKEKITEYVFEATKYLIENDCKAIVIACNTATSMCIDLLRKEYKNIPIIGIEPAVKVALTNNEKEKRVLVVATDVTVNGDKLNKLIKEYDKKNITDKIPLTKLVNYAENGVFDKKIIVPFLKEKLKNYKLDEYSYIVLGCTHFPYFKDSFKEIMPNARIVDGSTGCSNYLKTRLEEENLLADKKIKEEQIIFIESNERIKDTKRMKNLLERLKSLEDR